MNTEQTSPRTAAVVASNEAMHRFRIIAEKGETLEPDTVASIVAEAVRFADLARLNVERERDGLPSTWIADSLRD